MSVLLDSSVLIALALDEHVHNAPADGWFAELDGRFATCPITQGALVRTVIRSNAPVPRAVALLRHITALKTHEFWADDIGYAEVRLAGLIGHRQVTDAYLAALARHHKGRVATFDIGFAAMHPDVSDLVPVGG